MARMSFDVCVINNENNAVPRGTINVPEAWKAYEVFRELRRQNFVGSNFDLTLIFRRGIGYIYMTGLCDECGQKIWSCDKVCLCTLIKKKAVA